MSTQYGLRKSIKADELFDGRLEAFGVRESDEQKPMTSRELLAEGWELTRESMALVGLPIPREIEFQIDDRNHERATRIAELGELAQAIGAIDELSSCCPVAKAASNSIADSDSP